MLAHAGVGGTNNNCRTEGGWNGVKKEVCGSAGSTTSLSVPPDCAYSCPIDSSLPEQQEQGECLALETRHQVKMQDLKCHVHFP